MKTKISIWTISALIMIIIFSVTASAQMNIPASEKAKEISKASDNSPVIKKTGNNFVLIPPGLEKKTFIHYSKPDPECGNGICEPGEKKTCPADCESTTTDSACYEALGRSVKWKNPPVKYFINPTNLDGLSTEFITDAITSGTGEWNLHAKDTLFGDYSIDLNATLDIDIPDGKNEIVFGYYPEENTIAITQVWGYFSGPPSTRRIIEFDILFNIIYIWGDATKDSTRMDLQDIATHELGHAVGLADLYEMSCSEETMYGYSVEGETKKRDLNDGDITGLQKLYGK
ncbi:MAG: matrixin family metalloprotease [bacterium]